MRTIEAATLKVFCCNKLFFLITYLLIVSATKAQFREIFKGNSASINEIKGISFVNPSTGFVVMGYDIGFTQDSGRTFSKRYITPENINYNGFSGVNGAAYIPEGITAFSKDSLLVYCNFFFEPTILFSANQGLNWKIVYHKPINPDAGIMSAGITDLKFPENSNIGFAVHHEEVLKTTDRGQTWRVVLSTPNDRLRKLSFPTLSTGYACGNNKIYKTINGGATWVAIALPTPGYQDCDNIFFTNNTNGYLSGQNGNKTYRTVDGGNSWVQTNDSSFNPVSGDDMYFVNDSTGYITSGGNVGASVYKTIDYGKYWEACVNTPDIATTYPNLFIHFKSIYFYNNQIGWAGGTNEYLSITTDGASKTRPEAYFTIDTVGFSIRKTVNLVNLSKKGYQYRWYKNNLLLSNNYSTYYVSDGLTIDTVKLIVSNGVYADTLINWIDTRGIVICAPKPKFSFVVDTSSVKFTSLNSSGSNYKHTWSHNYFSNAVVFDTTENPTFNFPQYGPYTITHTIQPIDAIKKWCMRDSVQQEIRIVRTQNCLQPILTATVDSFYNDQVRFSVQLAPTEYLYADKLFDGFNFSFNDGKPDRFISTTYKDYSGYKVFDANGTYNISVTVKNNFTGCVSNITKPITISMPDTANADFILRGRTEVFDSNIGSGLWGGMVLFYGKPNSKTKGKRNTWILYNKDTIHTGNDFNANRIFSVKDTKYSRLTDFVQSIVNCNLEYEKYTYDFFVDSLIVPITHIVYDSTTNQSDVKSMVFKLPTTDDLDSIQIIEDSVFPNLIYMKPMSSTNTSIYLSYYKNGSFWEPMNNWYHYPRLPYKGMELAYRLFTEANDKNIIACTSDCKSGTVRQVYKKYHKSKALAPCSMYPPDFTYKVDSVSSKVTLEILPQQVVANYLLGYQCRLYFGDGDSSVFVYSQNTHTYAKPGNYTVTLDYTPSTTYRPQNITTGCASKQVVKTINVVNLCNYTANISVARNKVRPATITFGSTVSPDTGNVRYTWYFGNGQTDTSKTATCKYKDSGTYLIQLVVKRNNICTRMFDTSIVITYKDLCDSTAKPTITSDANYRLVSSEANGNQWFIDTTTIISGAIGQRFKPSASGYFSVRVTQNGCATAFSERYYYLVTSVVDIEPNSFIKIAPNPVNEFIEITYLVIGVKNVTAELFDITGKKVLTKTNLRSGGKINISSLRNGNFILKVTSANGKVNTITQIIKQ